MSTKCSIQLVTDHNENDPNERYWHLFEELSDSHWYVHLKAPSDAKDEWDGSLRIPIGVWRELCKANVSWEIYLDMSPEELKAEAEKWANERYERWKAAENEGVKTVYASSGSLIAMIEEPIEKQIEAYIRFYTPPDWIKKVEVLR